MTAMAPERGGSSCNNGGRTLHNFSLPPRLSWGTQKLLRCSNSTPSLSATASPHKRRRHDRVFDGVGVGIEGVREKLMLDLRSEVENMRAAFLGDAGKSITAGEVRPWDLRTRRAVCGGGGDRKAVELSPVRVVEVEERDGGGDAVVPRVKFSVPLSRNEVEEDFLAMLGRRPPRKPKKRPRYIQKQLDTIFPGSWLSEITPDMYKVNETLELPNP